MRHAYRVVDVRRYDSADSGEKRSHAQAHVSHHGGKLFRRIHVHSAVRRGYCQFSHQGAQNYQPRVGCNTKKKKDR